MSNTKEKLILLVDDLKSSWYFRVWSLTFVVFFILCFTALIILSGQSEVDSKRISTNIYYENASSIYYPRFHFRSKGFVIDQVSCSFRGQPLNIALCSPSIFTDNIVPNKRMCQAVISDSVEIQNVHGNDFQNQINCNINISASPNTNEEIRFEFDFPNIDYTSGGNSFGPIEVQPNNNAWIILQKSIRTMKGVTQNEWYRELVYHSDVSTPNNYNITVDISSFGIFHWFESNDYNGWKAIGNIGGFSFFMVIMHTFVMILVGFVFVARSKFLYSTIGNVTPIGSNTNNDQYLKIPDNEGM